MISLNKYIVVAASLYAASFAVGTAKAEDSQVPVDIIYSPSMIGTAIEVTALRFATKVAIDGTYILASPLVTPENADQWYFPNSPF